jgi:hypothetical protein
MDIVAIADPVAPATPLVTHSDFVNQNILTTDEY